VPKPPVLVTPGGDAWDYVEWMWASQHDFDKSGNIIGVITEWDGRNMPARIDLAPASATTVIQRKGDPVPLYKIDNTEYRGRWSGPNSAGRSGMSGSYPVPGIPWGCRRWRMRRGRLVRRCRFRTSHWTGSVAGAVPKARMKHTGRVLQPKEIDTAKQWYRDVMSNGDLLVHGKDWEYDMIQAQQAGVEWLNARQATVPDIARFFGCPSDLIDAAVSGQNITYANMTQRNLEFLIMYLGPAVFKRERNLSKLLQQPRFVKLNTDALLRMDPQARALMIDMRIKNKTLTNSEARDLDNLAPLTDGQRDEFNQLYPIKMSPATVTGRLVRPHQLLALQ